MTKFLKFTFMAMISSLLISGGLVGCTKKPNTEEVGKLEEAKAAAESAERKLSELRVERVQLEKDLNGASGSEQSEQQEIDGIQNPDEGETPDE